MSDTNSDTSAIDEKKQQDSILSNVDNEIQNLEKLKL